MLHPFCASSEISLSVYQSKGYTSPSITEFVCLSNWTVNSWLSESLTGNFYDVFYSRAACYCLLPSTDERI